MQEVKSESDALITRISNIVEKLFQKDTTYQYYLDKKTIIPFIFRYHAEKFALKMQVMSDFELSGLIEAELMTQLLIEGEDEQIEVLNRISPIVDTLFQNHSFLNEKLDKHEMIYFLVNTLMRKYSGEQIQTINDEDLKGIIEGLLLIEAVAGTLNDLTPEQIEQFDAAVAGI